MKSVLVGILFLSLWQSSSAAADDAPKLAVTFESLVETPKGKWKAHLRIANTSGQPMYVATAIHGRSIHWSSENEFGGFGGRFQQFIEAWVRYQKLSPLPPLKNGRRLSSGWDAPLYIEESIDIDNESAERFIKFAEEAAFDIKAEVRTSVHTAMLDVHSDGPRIFGRDISLECKQHPAEIAVRRFGEPEPKQSSEYVIVTSASTSKDEQWSKVIGVLKSKHSAHVITYDKHPDENLAELKADMPRHIAFVATPKEATREFVAAVHRLTRKLDDDPYTDALWGIVTGFDAQNALNIVQTREPLSVKKVAAGTDVELAACTEGIWYCELKKNRMVRKLPDGAAVEERGPDDTTQALAATLSDYHADLFVTSGHATERDWQIGFAYRNGSFRSKEGRLFGYPTLGKAFEIKSDNPKVYLAVGNCLMGNIDSQDAMALAWLNSAGVRQMAGYTVLTWYGYAGWGMLDYYLEQPGRFNMAEAFFANQQALVHRLETEFPEIARENPEPGKTKGRGDGAGLLHDRDVLAFYGDPKWDARLAPGPLRWEQTIVEKDGKWTLTITPKAGADTFKTVNKNGSQRGNRPIVAMLPRRISGKVEIESGAELKPVITDDFVLVPLPTGEVKDKYEVVWREVN